MNGKYDAGMKKFHKKFYGIFLAHFPFLASFPCRWESHLKNIFWK
jgi:hypothetical protein